MLRIRFFAFALLALLCVDGFAQEGSAPSLLNPNTASADEMATLPGMNRALAAAVVAGRPWASMKALDESLSDQLGGEEREALYEGLFLPIDLNTARASEIRMIPGMSRKMVHEFEDYRPYASMSQFRREIGKYADAEEVERLARYVTLGDG